MSISQKNMLKGVHFTSTIWFVLCISYIFVVTLLRTGSSWWFITPLSGYSVFLLFLLISFYLFAIFRGVARSQKMESEHPLTTSIYYLLFYNVIPFLGAFAGFFTVTRMRGFNSYLLMAAIGSLWATFLVWIIVDPLTGLAEMVFPLSREHRQRRLAQVKAMHEQDRLAKESLLAEIESEEMKKIECWKKNLLPYAERLAQLMSDVKCINNETEAVDIGVKAWQLGGLACMQQLHSMAMELNKQKGQSLNNIDYISIWWDGVGGWRSYCFETEGQLVS